MPSSSRSHTPTEPEPEPEPEPEATPEPEPESGTEDTATEESSFAESASAVPTVGGVPSQEGAQVEVDDGEPDEASFPEPSLAVVNEATAEPEPEEPAE